MDGGLNKRMGLGYAAYRNRRRRKNMSGSGREADGYKNIRFLESQGHNIIVHTPEGEYRFRQTMKEKKHTVECKGRTASDQQIKKKRSDGSADELSGRQIRCRRYRNYLPWLREWSSCVVFAVVLKNRFSRGKTAGILAGFYSLSVCSRRGSASGR